MLKTLKQWLNGLSEEDKSKALDNILNLFQVTQNEDPEGIMYHIDCVCDELMGEGETFFFTLDDKYEVIDVFAGNEDE